MRSSTTDGATLHHCDRCGGFWFSDTDAAVLSEDKDADMNWIDVAFWKDPDHIRMMGYTINCPQCLDRRLLQVQDEATGTEAATCPACNGIWLDADHLDNIVATLSKAVDRMDSADYARQSLRLLADILATPGERNGEEWHDLKTVLRLLKYRLYSEHPKVVRAIADTLNGLPV